MKIGKPQTGLGQRIQMGRLNPTAIAGEVPITQIVGHDDDKVGAGCRTGWRRQCMGTQPKSNRYKGEAEKGSDHGRARQIEYMEREFSQNSETMLAMTEARQTTVPAIANRVLR